MIIKPKPPEFLTENRRNTLRDNELAYSNWWRICVVKEACCWKCLADIAPKASWMTA